MWTLGTECRFFKKTYFLSDKNNQNKFFITFRMLDDTLEQFPRLQSRDKIGGNKCVSERRKKRKNRKEKERKLTLLQNNSLIKHLPKVMEGNRLQISTLIASVLCKYGISMTLYLSLGIALLCLNI